MDMLKILLAALASSVVWLFVGSIIYTSKGVKSLYRRSRSGAGVKKWVDTNSFYLFHYIILFVNSFFASMIFTFVEPTMPDSVIWKTLIFGTFMCVFQTMPRILEMALRSSYPVNLLFIEFLNYTMSGFAVALTIALIL